MPIGPGKYDSYATFLREQTRAEAVAILVLNGERGTGFSVQGPLRFNTALPDLLEHMAREIRKSIGQEKPLTINPDLLKRLYAAARAESSAASQLATDTLSYISALEHALQDDNKPMSFERMLLILGQALGGITAPANHDLLVSVVRNGTLNAAYLIALRDQLTDVIDEAGREVLP